MIDKITDLFKEVKHRLTNPLISSFIISWLITNWRVPIGMIMYSNKELHEDWYGGYFQLIYNEATWCKFLIIPLALALFYTFGFPILNAWILAFQAYVRVRSDQKNMEIMKDYYVPMDRFVKQKDKFNDLSEKLQKLYTEDSKTVEENAKLKSDIIKLNNDIANEQNEGKKVQDYLNGYQSKLKRAENLSHIRVLKGTWNYSVKTPEKITTHELIINTETRRITDVIGTSLADILSFSFNINKEEFTLVLNVYEEMRTIMAIDVHIMQISASDRFGDFYSLKGKDLKNNEVMYTRSDVNNDISNDNLN